MLHTPNAWEVTMAGESGWSREFCREYWKQRDWPLNPPRSHPKTAGLPVNAMMDNLQISSPWPRKLLRTSAE